MINAEVRVFSYAHIFSYLLNTILDLVRLWHFLNCYNTVGLPGNVIHSELFSE